MNKRERIKLKRMDYFGQEKAKKWMCILGFLTTNTSYRQ